MNEVLRGRATAFLLALAPTLLLGCGTGGGPKPAGVTDTQPTVFVSRGGANVPMRSVYALLTNHGNVSIVFSSEARGCTDADTFEARPGELTFNYELGQHMLHDGSIVWARRGYSYATGSGVSLVSSIGEDMPRATVENRPGGRIRFRLTDDDEQPLALTDTMSARGTIDTTVCPSGAPPDPARGTGTVEVAGRAFPIGIALLRASPDDPDYRQSMSLEIAILGWEPASGCRSKDVPGYEANLKFDMTKQGELLSATLGGARYSDVIGSAKTFTIQPRVTDLKDGDTVELRGSGEFFEHAYLNNDTGAFVRGDGAPYRLRIDGKVRILDCRASGG